MNFIIKKGSVYEPLRVPGSRLELPTSGLWIQCSNQLSYPGVLTMILPLEGSKNIEIWLKVEIKFLMTSFLISCFEILSYSQLWEKSDWKIIFITLVDSGIVYVHLLLVTYCLTKKLFYHGWDTCTGKKRRFIRLVMDFDLHNSYCRGGFYIDLE